jgi:hypothetical protein
VTKEGRWWLAEIPAFDAMTQGRTKKEALEMAADLIETMAETTGFRVTIGPTGGESFEVGANQVGTFVALLLRRQRERHRLTLAQVAKRLGQTSPNAYARYEQGKSVPTIEKLEELLAAVSPDCRIVWRLAA